MSKLAFLKYSAFLFAGAGTLTAGSSLLLRKKLNRLERWFFGLVILGSTLGVYARFIEPNWIVVSRVVIRDAELAKSLEGVRIVQISDIHVTGGLGMREAQLVKKVNALKPDFLFITGDFVDHLREVKPMRELLSKFKARMGIWGVPGNTDHISFDGREFADALQLAGIKILVNESERLQVAVGKYFWLVGSDDPVYGYADLDRALSGVPPGAPTILLAHAPNIFDKAIREKINLVLVGHTHGGQIGIPFLVHLSEYANRTPYMRGLFKKDATQLYVNRGIGTKTLPIRFLCPPEISLIEVVK